MRRIKEAHEKEVKVHEEIEKRMREELDKVKIELKEVKAIMRTPILY